MKQFLIVAALLISVVPFVAADYTAPDYYWSFDNTTWNGTHFSGVVGGVDVLLYDEGVGGGTANVGISSIAGEGVALTSGSTPSDGRHILLAQGISIPANTAWTVCGAFYFTDVNKSGSSQSLFWMERSGDGLETMYSSIDRSVISSTIDMDWGVGNDSNYNLGMYLDQTPAPNVVQNDTWLFICNSYDTAINQNQSDAHFYFNGVEYTFPSDAWYVDPGFPGIQIDLDTLNFAGGAYRDGTGNVYGTIDGTADELYVYNQALSPSDISTLSTAVLAGEQYPFITNTAPVIDSVEFFDDAGNLESNLNNILNEFGDNLTVQVNVSDADNNTMNVSVTITDPSNNSVTDTIQNTLTGGNTTFLVDEYGVWSYNVTVTDGTDSASSAGTFTISNTPPVITSLEFSQTCIVQGSCVIQITVDDDECTEANQVESAVVTSPSSAVVLNDTSWTLTSNSSEDICVYQTDSFLTTEVGTYNVVASLTDNQGASNTDTFQLSVQAQQVTTSSGGGSPIVEDDVDVCRFDVGVPELVFSQSDRVDNLEVRNRYGVDKMVDLELVQKVGFVPLTGQVLPGVVELPAGDTESFLIEYESLDRFESWSETEMLLLLSDPMSDCDPVVVPVLFRETGAAALFSSVSSTGDGLGDGLDFTSMMVIALVLVGLFLLWLLFFA